MRRGLAAIVLIVVSTTLTGCEVDFEPDDNLTWLALGDSYSSGEGLLDALDQPGVHRCQRSPSAYAPAAAALVASAPAFEPVVMLACTGATVRSPAVGSTPERKHGDWAGQLEALSVGDRFDVITLTFGGNDVEFGQTIEACIRRMVDAYGRSILIGGVDWLVLRLLVGGFCEIDKDDSLVAMKNLRLTLTENYVRTAAHLKQDGELYVLGYPRLFAPPDDWPIGEKLGGLCSGIKGADAATLTDLSDALNKTIKSAASAADALVRSTGRGVTFVPVSDLYEHHELCGKGRTWLNGFPTFDLEDRGEPLDRLKASFHPNADGHLATAARVADRVSAQLGLDR